VNDFARADLFAVDGALRDVCVLDVGLPEWSRLIEALPGSGREYSLAVTTEPPLADLSAEAIFERLDFDPEASARLEVRAGHVPLVNFFFETTDIEFSFDPEQVAGPDDVAALEAFMRWLATTCRKPAILTMETTDHRSIPALVTVQPAEG
jgi:hypothetical protein